MWQTESGGGTTSAGLDKHRSLIGSHAWHDASQELRRRQGEREMTRTRAIGLFGLGLLAVAGSGASASTMLYQNNFEGGYLDFHWQGNSRIGTDATIYTVFNGHQSNTAIDFHYAQAAPSLLTGQYVEYTLLFDFYAFDSWDGDSAAGSDRFMVYINDAIKFNESFSNNPALPQSFREPDMPRANYGGYTSWNDAIYRNISIVFKAPLNDPKVRIRFQDGGLGGYNDESWGIDNFRLSYNVVPTPGAVGLALAGGVLMAGRRRRANA